MPDNAFEPLNLDAVIRALPEGFTTRFAPSPTGALHLGHVAHAIFVWGLAGARAGRVILRMEDHDRTRCRPEFEAAILEDAAWLGFLPALPDLADFAAGPSDYRQSDCDTRYDKAFWTLRDRGLVYACDCSRKKLLARVGAATGETPYDGHCRDRGLAFDGAVGVRARMPDTPVAYIEAGRGLETRRPADECGDVLIRDRHGCWTYHFAVVVDDLHHGVNVVIRGEDLRDSTGRQVQLARMLGATEAPAYFHHPLVRAPDGRKLSKREADLGLREMRGAGASPEAVLGEAAFRVGLRESAHALTPEAMRGIFQA